MWTAFNPFHPAVCYVSPDVALCVFAEVLFCYFTLISPNSATRSSETRLNLKEEFEQTEVWFYWWIHPAGQKRSSVSFNFYTLIFSDSYTNTKQNQHEPCRCFPGRSDFQQTHSSCSQEEALRACGWGEWVVAGSEREAGSSSVHLLYSVFIVVKRACRGVRPLVVSFGF